MRQPNDLSRPRVARKQDATRDCGDRDEPIVLARRRHGAGSQRPASEEARSRRGGCCSLDPWRKEATRAGHTIKRFTVAYEVLVGALARARQIEAIERSCAAQRQSAWARSRSSELFWIGCGEPNHCSMAVIPTLEDEDAKPRVRGLRVHVHPQQRRPSREFSTEACRHRFPGLEKWPKRVQHDNPARLSEGRIMRGE